MFMQARRAVLLWSIWIYTVAYASFIGLIGILLYMQSLNNSWISNEFICVVWASAHEETDLVL